MGLLVLAAVLQACSMVRFAYNQAPDALYWWLDGYFGFTEVQSLKLKADLASFQQWHRRTELPAYAALLQKLQQLAPNDVLPQQVCDLLAEARQRAVALSDALEPTIVALAPTLAPEQIVQLEKQLDKRNRKWREEWIDVSPQELTERRVKQAVDRAEMFYGRLEEPQLAVARATVQGSAFDPRHSLRETLRRQRDALQTLRQLQSQQPGEAHVRTLLRTLFERSMNSPDAAYRSYLESMTRTGCQAIAALHNSTTPAQRLRAAEKLRSYEQDARLLSLQK